MPRSESHAVTKLETQLAAIFDKLSENVQQQQKMWERIDETIERLIKLETVIHNSELKKIGHMEQRISLIEAWKDSVWRFAQPAFSAVAGGIVSFVIAKLLQL